MLVYGDHQFQAQLQPLCARLVTLAEQALTDQNKLDLLRTLLIFCGQVEQGAHDTLVQLLPAAAAKPLITGFHQATAQAAAAFYSVAYRQSLALPPPLIATEVALRTLLDTLAHLQTAPDAKLIVKVPEGFNLYALYPEQYLVAAGQWLADHRSQQAQGAVVVGIRSIGTTLAAVVSTVLQAAGWAVHSYTVRPTGHPYDRQVNLDDMTIQPTALALIVDEGPGISGSSMAATASALVKAGIARDKIAFLPGHPNEPGGVGAAAVKLWWQTAPRYVADLGQLTFAGRSLQAALAATLPEPVVKWEEFSGGLWRRAVYADQQAWPALCTAFERMKFCYTLASGRQVLYKFLGLASNAPALISTTDRAAALLNARVTMGLTMPVLGRAYGFVATEWINGRPLDRSELSPELIETVGAYMAQVAGPAMAADEAHAAVASLREMLIVNTREALGEAAAQLVQHDPIPIVGALPTYGDGHLQPYEWLYGNANRLYKTDSVGHDCDHTLVGKQAVVWDLAGAIVEWGLTDDEITHLLNAFTAACGPVIPADALHFYRAAYLAFRLGQCTMAAQVHDPYERARLQHAIARYHQQLAQLLGLQL